MPHPIGKPVKNRSEISFEKRGRHLCILIDMQRPLYQKIVILDDKGSFLPYILHFFAFFCFLRKLSVKKYTQYKVYTQKQIYEDIYGIKFHEKVSDFPKIEHFGFFMKKVCYEVNGEIKHLKFFCGYNGANKYSIEIERAPPTVLIDV